MKGQVEDPAAAAEEAMAALAATAATAATAAAVQMAVGRRQGHMFRTWRGKRPGVHRLRLPPIGGKLHTPFEANLPQYKHT